MRTRHRVVVLSSRRVDRGYLTPYDDSLEERVGDEVTRRGRVPGGSRESWGPEELRNGSFEDE